MDGNSLISYPRSCGVVSLPIPSHGQAPARSYAASVFGNLHMIGKLPHQSLQKLAKKYGPIMYLRLGNVPAVVVLSPEAAELFLKTHDRAFSGRPNTGAIENLYYRGRGVVFMTYGPHLKNAKKLCASQLLSLAKVGSSGPMRKEELGRLVEKFKDVAAAREAVDLTVAVGQLMGDMYFKMILGGNFMDTPKLKAIIHEALGLLGASNLADYVPFLRVLDLQGINRRAKAIHLSFDRMLEEIIEEHKRNAGSESEGDFVDVLLSMLNQPARLENELQDHTMDHISLKAMLIDTLSAADDSSSVAIDWAFTELLRNPLVLARLQEEVNAVVGMDRMVEEADLTKFKYLEMVVKETLRLHTIGPLLLPHESMEDTVVNGYHIPKKTRIIVNAGAIGRDPKVWSSNAEQFIPERFIDDNVSVRGSDYRLLPFGSGRRSCPGILLALTNVQLVIAQLVHCFKWELPHGMLPSDLDMTEKYGVSVFRANHLIVKPTYRLLVYVRSYISSGVSLSCLC